MTAATGPKYLGPNVDKCTTDAEHELGEIAYGKNGCLFRYVQFVDAVAYKHGAVCVLADADQNEWKVTIDVSGGSAMAGLHPVGVIHHATADVPTQNQYGWVQCTGVADIVAGSASIVAGDFLMPDTSEDGDATEATAGTDENIFAIALATIADNATGKALLRKML